MHPAVTLVAGVRKDACSRLYRSVLDRARIPLTDEGRVAVKINSC